MRWLLPIVLGIILVLPAASTAADIRGRLETDRGEFLLRLNDGRILRGDALIGSTLILNGGGKELKTRIDRVEQETTATGEPVLLYSLSVELVDGGAFQNICQPDAKGRQAGFPITRDQSFDFTCTSGAQGKCILMGYRPWDTRGDAPMHDLHRACIHMVRADYGGDGHPATRDGTIIDVYDRFGIQKPSNNDPMPFEAAWGRDGALCVAHPRIAQNMTLDELEARYPILREQLGPENCTFEKFRHDPRALIFNRSTFFQR